MKLRKVLSIDLTDLSLRLLSPSNCLFNRKQKKKKYLNPALPFVAVNDKAELVNQVPDTERQTSSSRYINAGKQDEVKNELKQLQIYQ